MKQATYIRYVTAKLPQFFLINKLISSYLKQTGYKNMNKNISPPSFVLFFTNAPSTFLSYGKVLSMNLQPLLQWCPKYFFKNNGTLFNSYQKVSLAIWNHLFLKFWLVSTWAFAHWCHQCVVTRLENVCQLNIR